MTALLLLLLAAHEVGSIRVEVRGGSAEVVVLRDGEVYARVATRNGLAEIHGLRRGAYDLYAVGKDRASRLTRGVRTVYDGSVGVDAILLLEPVYAITVATAEGATVWSGGIRFEPGGVRLPRGLHRIVVDHPRRVSSRARVLRVTGGMQLHMPLEPGLVVLGRVVDGSGTPLAGARVRAFADGLAKNRATLTAADGTFGLAGFFGDVVSVEVAARGYATALRRIDIAPGSERARLLVRMTVGSAVSLETNTVAQALLLPAWYEESLEEPRLRANHAPARRTGKRVLFAGLMPGRRYRILLSAPEHLPGSTATFVAPPAGTTTELPGSVLRRAASIHGTVALGEGRVVHCRGPEGVTTSRTDRNGAFELTGLDAGKHFLTLRDVDEKAVEITLAAGEQRTVTLRPEDAKKERMISGIVMDADGVALEGALVEVAGRETITNAKGEFTIRNLPRGRELYTVRFTPGPDCRALKEDPHLPHSERRVRVGAKLRIPLKRSGTLRLKFDTVLARATLLISSNDNTVRRRLPRRARGIDVEELPLGSYSVDVAAPGLLGSGGVVLPVRREAGKPVLLALARGRRAAGRVVLRRTKLRKGRTPLISDEPVSRGWVSMLDASALHAMAVTPIEEDGSFVLDGLPLGSVILCAAVPGLPTSVFEVDLAAADRVDLVFPMQAGVAAVVFITGEKGKPVLGATVRILDMLRPDFGVDVRDVAALGRFRRVVADDIDLPALARAFRLLRASSGRVEAPFLHPGSYRFLVSAKGYKPVRVGVRARSTWQEEQIRESLKDVAGVPDVLETRVRLARAETKH